MTRPLVDAGGHLVGHDLGVSEHRFVGDQGVVHGRRMRSCGPDLQSPNTRLEGPLGVTTAAGG